MFFHVDYYIHLVKKNTSKLDTNIYLHNYFLADSYILDYVIRIATSFLLWNSHLQNTGNQILKDMNKENKF